MRATQLAYLIANELERQAEENPSKADCDSASIADMNSFRIDGRFDLEALAVAIIEATRVVTGGGFGDKPRPEDLRRAQLTQEAEQ